MLKIVKDYDSRDVLIARKNRADEITKLIRKGLDNESRRLVSQAMKKKRDESIKISRLMNQARKNNQSCLL